MDRTLYSHFGTLDHTTAEDIGDSVALRDAAILHFGYPTHMRQFYINDGVRSPVGTYTKQYHQNEPTVSHTKIVAIFCGGSPCHMDVTGTVCHKAMLDQHECVAVLAQLTVYHDELQAELVKLFARAKSEFGLTTSIDVALPDAR